VNSMLRKMVLIGGGRFSETVPFLREIVSLCDRSDPLVLLIPTAGYDSQQTISIWADLFDGLGAEVESLLLLKDPPSPRQIEETIGKCNAVYVPGGDTRHMMKVWRKLGVDKALRRAFRDGTVLSGRSAGAGCWFRRCLSADASGNTRTKVIEYRRVSGIGLVDATLCTHYSNRREAFEYCLRQTGGVGLGLDDGVAVSILGREARVISLNAECGAYTSIIRDGFLHEERLAEGCIHQIESILENQAEGT
jgi:dipeptidase E